MKLLIKQWDKKIRNEFTLWDIGFLKIYGAIPGLIIGALFPDFFLKYAVIFLVLFGLLMLRYLYLLFVKKQF